jgi:hypothetical protein
MTRSTISESEPEVEEARGDRGGDEVGVAVETDKGEELSMVVALNSGTGASCGGGSGVC